MKQRSTAATKINESSSRSHFILQIALETTHADGRRYSSKINLIDLAGSEDNKRTGNVGVRMTESGAINKSLFVLGQVVEALNKNLPRIPYRDSKITRFLQDSLGGKAIGIMIACCAPEEEHYLDTYNTLNFAAKSSLVRNVSVVNELPKRESQERDRLADFIKWKKMKNNECNSSSELQKDNKSNIQLNKVQKNTGEIEQSPYSALHRKLNLRLDQKLEELKSDILDPLLEERKLLQEKVKFLQSKDIHDYLSIADSLLDKSNAVESLVLFKKILEKIDPIAQVDLYAQTNRKIKEIESKSSDAEHSKENTVNFLLKNTELKILNILNQGTLKEIKKLKMIGDKRAAILTEFKNVYGDFLEVFQSFNVKMQDLQKAGLSNAQISGILKANLNL